MADKQYGVVVRQDFTRTIGLFHGNPIYWPDLMRVAPDHREPRSARLWWAIGRFFHMRGYAANKRRARREMDAWGIEHPFLKPSSSDDSGKGAE